MSTPADISQSLSQGANETAERLARRPKPKALLIRDTPRVSFELFPPSTPEGQTGFVDTADQLDVLGGTFMSVTYGASGTSQARTLNALQTLTSRCTTPMAGHLTCAGESKGAVMAVVEAYRTAGVGQVIALRGDPPRGQSTFQPHPRGFASAFELVSAISRRGGFDIGVAAYPEVHPEARSDKDDLDNLKRKIDAGARYAITQFFFEADTFLRFRDRAVAAGIQAPIIPGILPVVNLKRTVTMAKACGTHVPGWVESLFDGLADAPRVRTLVSATIAAELCTRLRDHGVDRFHFYTLNRSELAWAVCRMLGLRTVQRTQPCPSAAASHA